MTQALRKATSGVATRPKTLADVLTDPKIKAQMALALPRHMTADRLARIALTEIRKNPDLAQCDPTSFLGAVMQCAQLGLEPGSVLGHAYLLPFNNNKKGIKEVQFIVGYRGMIDLARRSGQILSIEARAVYPADKFSVTLGLNPDLQHVPDWDAGEQGKLSFVYAVAKLKDGGTQFEVMSRAQIERVRSQSKAGNAGPWVTHFDEMAKKTVIRRLFKYLPVSIELSRAVGMDEQVDLGVTQDNPLMIDNETGEIMEGGSDAGSGNFEKASLSYAQVAEALNKASNIDLLDAAADLIKEIPDEQQRVELSEIYRTRMEALAS